MWPKLKALFSQLKSYKSGRLRKRIYIIPSVSGLVLSVFIAATYLLSFADRNPWLASLSFSGFAWFVIALFLTHKTVAGLNLSSDGRITNTEDEPKHGLRLDGVELPELPAFGTLRVKLPPDQKRYRISTFFPTGLFYSWTFQKTNRAISSDIGESLPYRRGSPWARIDWKLWFRRGRFTATPMDPNMRLRPMEESAPERLRAWATKNHNISSDAGSWAFLWSLIVFLTLGTFSMYFAPLWAGVVFFGWVVVTAPGLFAREKFRYWGRLNFFFSWIVLALVIVAGKARLEPWMITTPTIAMLFIPFTLHLKITSANNLMRRLRKVVAIAVLTLAFLYSARSFISERFQYRGSYYGSGNNYSDVNWGASLSSNTLRTAERFLVRGQGIFWVPYSREQQLQYRFKLPYWRETTYTESRGGLNWTTRVTAADAGAPIEVNLFLPGREALQLQRQPPTTNENPVFTAYDEPSSRPMFIYSQRVRELAASLKLDAKKPAEASKKVIDWMKTQNFRYSLRPGRMADVEEFLFRRKIGLCQHYAGSLAYILRAANIPARVVAGYHGGEVDTSEETLLMRDLDAHAWVEVWNPKAAAWILVDPTSALFPNEFRLVPDRPVMRALTKAIVKMQSRWSKLQSKIGAVILLALTLGSLIAMIGILSRLVRRRKHIPNAKDNFVSSPKVREWEARMQKHFHKRRKTYESLSAYFARVATKPEVKTETLKKDLKELLKQLYAD